MFFLESVAVTRPTWTTSTANTTTATAEATTSTAKTATLLLLLRLFAAGVTCCLWIGAGCLLLSSFLGILYVCHNKFLLRLKLQSGFARCVGQSLHFPMVTCASPVKNDL